MQPRRLQDEPFFSSDKRPREESAEERCRHEMSARDYQVKNPFDTPKSNENQRTTANKLKKKENRVYCRGRSGYKLSCAVARIVPCARDRRCHIESC
ncbi:hypothetical protein EYC80_005101 [Monilinia laxa]|uniref:Uncharacterized protein n=1 Tax=Monilinia laxa TaxID=61186 RepID=A0A5N6KJ60_MONLA|nr:hypothetical protein EYC80_005101 [Monilinia laxa]